LLPPKPEQRDELVRVLLRAGEDGADALLERLAEAQKAEDRRVYIDVALWLRANAPALIRDAALLHMLADDRWFVARTAAELLGEMKVTAAEEQLQSLLRHDDERIRRSAATALLQLGTPSGRQAIEGALADASPDVRILAASAMASVNDDEAMTSTATLLRVLDEEQDPTVQLALLAALGRLATPNAVEHLTQAAEPEGRFFKKKTLEFRLAAVQALGEARTDAALSALQALESDREREVRDAVAHAQVHARRTR
jgi:HEAT repeat protein